MEGQTVGREEACLIVIGPAHALASISDVVQIFCEDNGNR